MGGVVGWGEGGWVEWLGGVKVDGWSGWVVIK